jgi:hypothetical protein
MNPILERDGTGAVEGHSAAEALHSLLRTMEALIDGCTGRASDGAALDGFQLATALLAPVQALATEHRREHGDDPSLRLGILRLEQRVRDHLVAYAPASPTPP